MHQTLEIFRLAGGLAGHAAARQDVIARNVAHADTPGYRARDIAPFAESYRDGGAGLAMQATRAGHLASAAAPGPGTTAEVAASASPNGNSVSLEAEMVKATETRHDHELALAVYKSALGILRTSLGRAR